MKNHQSGPLKLYTEDATATLPPKADDWPGMVALCRAFAEATGWELRYEATPANAPPAANVAQAQASASGRLVATPAKTAREATQTRTAETAAPTPRLAPLAADRIHTLVAGLNALVDELNRTRVALWQREAELAAGVPVTTRHDEREQLAARLEGVLRTGTEAVGCQAAAIYMLDEATSELKLRASWGLPKERLLEPARPLRTAIADLEALLGSAVVLDDTRLLPHWKPPENFPAAVCLPISSPTSPLGTMWVFSNRQRDFTAAQTGLLEIVSGRIAAELERAVLLKETTQVKRPDADTQRIVRWQRNRLPQIEPLLDGWEVAGWTPQNDRVGGEFFDWNVLPSGDLALAVGAADGSPVEASLTAAALHSALRSHSLTTDCPKQLMTRMNDTFWMSSTGDQTGSLACAMLSTETADLHFSGAGRVGGLIVASRKTKLILPTAPALGLDPDASFSVNRRRMTRSSLAILFTLPPDRRTSDRRTSDRHPPAHRPPAPANAPVVQAISEMVRTHRTANASQLLEAIRNELRKYRSDAPTDCSLLILKKTH